MDNATELVLPLETTKIVSGLRQPSKESKSKIGEALVLWREEFAKEQTNFLDLLEPRQSHVESKKGLENRTNTDINFYFPIDGGWSVTSEKKGVFVVENTNKRLVLKQEEDGNYKLEEYKFLKPLNQETGTREEIDLIENLTRQTGAKKVYLSLLSEEEISAQGISMYSESRILLWLGKHGSNNDLDGLIAHEFGHWFQSWVPHVQSNKLIGVACGLIPRKLREKIFPEQTTIRDYEMVAGTNLLERNADAFELSLLRKIEHLGFVTDRKIAQKNVEKERPESRMSAPEYVDPKKLNG